VVSWLFRLVWHGEVINLPNALDIVDFFAYGNHITPVLEYGYNSGQCPTQKEKTPSRALFYNFVMQNYKQDIENNHNS